MTERILAIDPGTTKSGWVLLEDGVPTKWGHDDNDYVAWRTDPIMGGADDVPDFIVMEYMRPRGMPTSADEMDTMYELGRMTARIKDRERLIKVSRHEIKMNLCGRVTAKDSNIRQALIDRFGGQAVAIGGKRCQTCKGKGWVGRGRPSCPDCYIENMGVYVATGLETPKGPLHGLSGHCWSALAVGLTYLDQRKDGADV